MSVAIVDDFVGQLAASWERGERQPAEYFFDRNPQLRENTEAAVALVYEEFCLRQERGETVTTDEYFERFPEWRAELEVLFDCHELIEPHGRTVNFPTVGERLGEFRLLAELGRGAQGHVYLASQPSLSNRQVVLKVTKQRGDEHLLLSQLQHTHIVPLYCVFADRQRNLSAFCMPYVGGATLEQILDKLRPRPVQERRGKEILAVLAQRNALMEATVQAEGRPWAFLKNASYTRAITWIFACLAEALAYMHERGLVHLDLKPSNVLIAGDGQPMLIDFHLAREPLRARTKMSGSLGGTFHYMSPEQRRAVDAVVHEEVIPTDVDGRSDVFSLGLVLYEALSGKRFASDGSRQRVPLRELNPKVSAGLSDIVDRCLAAAPSRRYANASDLANDLRRHLTHLPLRVAGNRSLAERWQKWRRRRPYGPALLASLLLVICGAAGTCFFGASHVNSRTSLAQSRLEEARRLSASGNHDEALRALQQAQRETEGFPGTAAVQQRLRAQMELVQQHKLAQRLSDLVDRLRMLEGFEELPASQLEDLYANCVEVWKKRDQLNAVRLGSGTGNGNQAMRMDLLDLGILLADLRGRLSKGVAGHRDALAILDDTEALFGVSAGLEVQRQFHAEAAGLTELALTARQRVPRLAPTTAWEHYALGRWLLGRQQPKQAGDHFRSAIELQPELFWPHFFHAVSAYRLEEYSIALNELNVCIALSPRRPECYYNRALVLAAGEQRDQAKRDLDRALKLSPNLEPARRQRAEWNEADRSTF